MKQVGRRSRRASEGERGGEVLTRRKTREKCEKNLIYDFHFSINLALVWGKKLERIGKNKKQSESEGKKREPRF